MGNAIKRPIIAIDAFNKALQDAKLSQKEEEIIEYIRLIAVFNQVTLAQALRLESRPPALSSVCEICRKIGAQIPNHLQAIREWSQDESEDGIHWDGNLVCASAWNGEGERLSPECGTTQYHTFVVHKELFLGLDY